MKEGGKGREREKKRESMYQIKIFFVCFVEKRMLLVSVSEFAYVCFLSVCVYVCMCACVCVYVCVCVCVCEIFYLF
jgi:hypothetical protein